MRHYEVLFIVKPTLTEDEIKTKVDFVKEIIAKNGGEIAGRHHRDEHRHRHGRLRR
ncbi:MAG: 30S ribosomal protein S6, partial [Campylobacter sp.]|nr:30S ribosomal protein S6 [Campylobacter sp.]